MMNNYPRITLISLLINTMLYIIFFYNVVLSEAKNPCWLGYSMPKQAISDLRIRDFSLRSK